ncbi:type II toxin-antitoxin system PemK/MazF family toxin [Jatrophihabitans sp. GAS493]|uniref:type II toxin-antitoxin system PemK/MazF family toxin n=1 Tax=Jatrophihabitans sp. GAS493 TaxID=1907575 RepID=UPI0018D501D3|nr:type II toxin-antitoxin system PemK/MazF family toxin [Jatrophihabitans sp. GAS493]
MFSRIASLFGGRSGSASPRNRQRADYLGDFTGVARAEYAPKPNGRPDPGEIVWTWVSYEDDPKQGKDRPVLLIGHDSRSTSLLGLALTSKDHHAGARVTGGVTETRDGRHWFDLGSGAWDPQGRPSEIRLDRVLRIDPAAVRREGASIDRARFDAVIAALKQAKGWR